MVAYVRTTAAALFIALFTIAAISAARTPSTAEAAEMEVEDVVEVDAGGIVVEIPRVPQVSSVAVLVPASVEELV
jgi:hypothetical protein